MDLALILLGLFGSALAWMATLPPRARLRRGPRLRDRLAVWVAANRMGLPASTFLGGMGASALAGGLVGLWLAGGVGLLVPVFAGVGGALFYAGLRRRRARFREAYLASLERSLDALRRSFAVNPNLMGAILQALPAMPEPARLDFAEAASRMQAGEGVAEAFAAIAVRRRDPYLDMVVEALAARERFGGNLRETLEGIQQLIADLRRIRGEIRARQTMARLEAFLLAIAPWIFLAAMRALFPDYEGGFYRTAIGQGVLAVVLGLDGLGLYLGSRIARAGLDLEG